MINAGIYDKDIVIVERTNVAKTPRYSFLFVNNIRATPQPEATKTENILVLLKSKINCSDKNIGAKIPPIATINNKLPKK